ncbi:MaoC family dehydratase [Halocalculus aciditolerans]|uniref:Acyl dehydratase n=1 Tax=Halocalculus aciditolerans TaxID=1383812 RepID=A0A830FAP4_9EURY|nr:MaoC family dehydratase [Halocalculus aciditolerans]GGL55717.1 acyl dehydratase [Halocalculus aciditolerans]
MADRIYYEDLSVGDVESFGSYEVTEAEVVEFAERYDPQWFHTDPEAAEESIYGGLIASGWHTASMTMRLLVDGHFTNAASLGAAGLEELRWPNPTRPGDVLTAEIEILEKRVSESNPDRGIVTTKTTTTNEEGETKLQMVSVVFYQRRDAGE